MPTPPFGRKDQASTPTLQKAEHFLELQLQSLIAKGETRFPALRKMAKEAHVSLGIMVEAVHRYRQRGLLSTVRGGRIESVTAQIHPRNLEVKGQTLTGSKSQRMIQELRQSVWKGTLPAGSYLPGIKEISSQYGLSEPTSRRVLRELAKMGVLESDRKRYRVPSFHLRKSNATLCLIGFSGYHSTNFWVLNDRLRTFVGTLETLCAKSGVHLKLIGYHPDQPERLLHTLRSVSACMGCIFWLTDWYVFEGEAAKLTSVLRQLGSLKSPLVLVDEFGELDWKSKMGPKSRVHSFSLAAQSAGKSIGKFLVQMGHRQVAFISYSHRHAWSKNRVAGLQQIFLQAGFLKGVKTFTTDNLHSIFDLYVALRDWRPGVYEKKWRMRHPDMHIKAADQHYDEIQSAQLFGFLNAKQLEGLKFPLKMVSRLPLERIPESFLNRLRAAATDFSTTEGHRLYLRPFFELALKEKEITAWVCATDAIALAALDFLKDRKVKVPHSISVIGFDNLPEAFDTGLTSYHFHVTALAERAFHALVFPTQNLSGNGTQEFDGFIVERESVQKVYH